MKRVAGSGEGAQRLRLLVADAPATSASASTAFAVVQLDPPASPSRRAPTAVD